MMRLVRIWVEGGGGSGGGGARELEDDIQINEALEAITSKTNI